MNQDTIAVIDLGSARTTDLARAVRALGVYTELHPHDLTAEQLAAIPNLRGIILAAGPRRAFEGQTLDLSQPLRDAGLPTLTVDDADATQPDLDAFIARTGAKRNWNMDNFIADQIEAIRAQVLSGGVDSSVVAALLIRAIGKQLTCVHVNHGLLRQGEPEQVVKVFREELGANLVYVDAVDRFLDKLAGVADPEQKRKIIGAESSPSSARAPSTPTSSRAAPRPPRPSRATTTSAACPRTSSLPSSSPSRCSSRTKSAPAASPSACPNPW